jgi:hypothetical protein
MKDRSFQKKFSSPPSKHSTTPKKKEENSIRNSNAIKGNPFSLKTFENIARLDEKNTG